MILNIILIIFVIFISDLTAYKIIRFIDKKERKKLYIFEEKYIKNLKEISK